MDLLLCSNDYDLIIRWKGILQKYHVETSRSIEGSRQLLQASNRRFIIFLHEQVATQEEVHQFILERPGNCSVLVGANNPNDLDGTTYLRSGANGYTNCYISSPRLQQAVQVLKNNGVWFSQSLMQSLIRGMWTEEKPQVSQTDSLDGLSVRQREVACLVADGFSNHAIGKTLFISESTVKVHLYNMYKKLNLKGRLALALLVKGKSGGSGPRFASGGKGERPLL